MAKVKNFYTDLIAKLSELTGYGFDFLLQRFNEVMDDDGDINYFVGVTLEKDW